MTARQKMTPVRQSPAMLTLNCMAEVQRVATRSLHYQMVKAKAPADYSGHHAGNACSILDT